MRTQLSNYLDNIITFLLFLVALLTPLFFLPFTTDPVNTPKLYLLAGMVLIILPLKALQWLILGRIYLNFTPLDLPLLLFIASSYIAVLISPAKFNSLTQFIPWVLYILLFFIIVNHIRTRNKYNLLILGLVLGVVLGCIGYLIGSLLTLSSPVIPELIFAPSGRDIAAVIRDPLSSWMPAYAGMTDISILSVLLAPILITLIIKAEGFFTSLLSSLSLSLMAAVFVLSGSYLTVLPIILSSLFFILTKPPRLDALPKISPLRLQLLTLPIVIGIVVFVLPISSSLRGDEGDAAISKLEIASHILAQQDQDSILLRGLAMTQIIQDDTLNPQALLVLIPLLLVIFTTLKLLSNRASHKESVDSAVTFSALTAVLSLLLFPVLTSLFFILYSYLVALKVVQHKTLSKFIYSLPIRQLILTIFLLIGTVGVVGEIRAIRADLANAQGLNQVDQPQQAYIHFLEAVNLIPMSDLYQANLSLASFSYAQSIAQIYSVASSQQSVVRENNSSDPLATSPIRKRDEQLIKDLLNQSLTHAKKAVELDPTNHQNYLILGFLQARISKVDPASGEEAYISFLKALELEPKSREIPFQIASWYYSLSEFNLALEFFQKAVSVDPAWANGHYNLGLTFKELQDIEKAKAELSLTLSLLNPGSVDFKAAETVLEGLSGRPEESTQAATLNLPSEDFTQKESEGPAPISGRTLIKNGKPI